MDLDASPQTGQALPRSHVPMPNDLRNAAEEAAELKRGVRSFVLLVSGLVLLGMASSVITEYALRGPEPRVSTLIGQLLSGIVVTMLAISLSITARGEHATPGLLRALSAAFYFLLVALITQYDIAHLLDERSAVFPSWMGLLVLAYAILVPASITYHATLIGLASVALIAGAVIASLTGQLEMVTLGEAISIAAINSVTTWLCAIGALVLVGEEYRRILRTRALRSELQKVSSYELLERFDAGGMGDIWRARHRLLSRPVAVKFVRLSERGLDNPADLRRVRARFEREAQVLARLTSPHTVRIFDCGITEQGVFFYTMELLEGMDLSTLVGGWGPQPQERVRDLLVQTCHSLAEAHSLGLIHRDIKPANIFISRQGLDEDVVKVLDFGLVAATSPDALDESQAAALRTAPGMLHGTPAFMSPEQVRGDVLTEQVDIYSLGCVAYYLLTGEYVFDAHSAAEQMHMHATQPPLPPSERADNIRVEPAFEALILTCLDKDPSRRPLNALVLREMLQNLPLREWTAQDTRAWYRKTPP
ncbi:MAG: serine/threonine protein kinase [Deltaproteobacteria bacterium]|nr:MAG: serine/threonine protein kinase [Deltaproteobacteria bacterium]